MKNKKRENNLKQLKKKFLEYYRQLPIQKLAAASIGKDETTIIRWKNKDANFANQVEDAKAAWALEHSKKVKSSEWILERVMKDHFAQRQEHTGKEGEELNVSVSIVEDKKNNE